MPHPVQDKTMPHPVQDNAPPGKHLKGTSVAICRAHHFGTRARSAASWLLLRRMGRISEVDLSDRDASNIFELNFGFESKAVRDIKSLAFYENLNFRSRGKWHALYPHRGLLGELFRASSGHLIHQVSLARHVKSYLANAKADADDKSSEKVAYRIRAMMSHLRDHAVAGRKPPMRFQMLQGPMSLIHLGCEPPAIVSGGEDACAMLSDVEPGSGDPCAGGDVGSSCDEDVHVVESSCAESVDIEALSSDLFSVEPETPVKVAKVKDPVELLTPPKASAPTIGNEDIDAMLASGPLAIAPTSVEYLAMKKPAAHRKKPAAHTKPMVIKKPAGKPVDNYRKNLYSCMYHRQLKLCKSLGTTDDAESYRRAAAAGREAVAKMAGRS